LANDILSGGWRPLSSIGKGQANMGIELIVIGWVLLGMAWAAGPGGLSARASVGRLLVSLGRRLARSTGAPEAESSTSV